jgi:hypothetical protein
MVKAIQESMGCALSESEHLVIESTLGVLASLYAYRHLKRTAAVRMVDARVFGAAKERRMPDCLLEEIKLANQYYAR